MLLDSNNSKDADKDKASLKKLLSIGILLFVTIANNCRKYKIEA